LALFHPKKEKLTANMGVASGIGHFFESIVEMIQGIFVTIFHIFEGAISAVLHFFQLALDTVFGLFKGFAHAVENTLGFAVRKSSSSPPAFLPSSVLLYVLAYPRHGDVIADLVQLDNFFILGTLAAVVFGYLLLSQRHGTTPASRTIKN